MPAGDSGCQGRIDPFLNGPQVKGERVMAIIGLTIKIGRVLSVERDLQEADCWCGVADDDDDDVGGGGGGGDRNPLCRLI